VLTRAAHPRVLGRGGAGQLYKRVTEEPEALGEHIRTQDHIHQVAAQLYADVPAVLLRVMPLLEDELRVPTRRRPRAPLPNVALTR